MFQNLPSNLLFLLDFKRPYLILLIIFSHQISIIYSKSERSDSPRVKISNGTLQGFQFDLTRRPANIKKADIFLGIPFAQPPINHLRLEKPQPASNWSGIRDATTLGAPCIPVHFLTAPGYSEDCLFLNVFRPSKSPEENSTSKYPVLVFIHGGGYNVGGNFVEGYGNITDNYVSHGLIVVTIQYRLGFFGFFSDGSHDFPGNYGLWDQRMALMWIQENIVEFGGDPTRVTLWGQSAGSASVSMLSISRHSRHLFHQVAQQSGSFLSPWALNEDVVDFSRQIAADLGCATRFGENDVNAVFNTSDEQERTDDDEPRNKTFTPASMRSCLKELQHEDVLFTLSTKELIRGSFKMVVFNPRYDGDFFDIDFRKAIRFGPKKPSLIGFNTHEAAFLTLDYGGSLYGFRGPMTIDDTEKFGTSDLIKFVNEKIHPVYNGSLSASDQKRLRSLRNKISQFYINKSDDVQKKDFHFCMEQYTFLLTDIMFMVPILWEARLKAESGWPTYLFQFDYSNPKMFERTPFKAITHGAEYPYTLGVHIFGSFEFNEEDEKMRKFLTLSMANFVKTGNPSTDEVFWSTLLPATKEEKKAGESLRTLRIRSSAPQMELGPKGADERFRFWDRLNKKYNFSRISGFPTFKRPF